VFSSVSAMIGGSRGGASLWTAEERWIAGGPGGWLLSNLGAGGLFAAMSGSSHATCAAIGKMGSAEMRKRGQGAHAVMIAHPWAPLLVVSRVNAGPAMMAYVDATLAALVGAGFSYAMADRIWNAMDSYIYGFSLQQIRFPFQPGDYAAVARQYLPMIPADVLPHMHALTVEVAEERHDGIQNFDFGFDLLLEAIDRLPRAPG